MNTDDLLFTVVVIEIRGERRIIDSSPPGALLNYAEEVEARAYFYDEYEYKDHFVFIIVAQ